MNNKEYVDAVNSNQFPVSNQVPLDLPFVDDRGTIQNLWLGSSGSITLITSKKGAIRASHWHQNDWHAIYILSGSIEYSERQIDGNDMKKQIFVPGEMVFSKPNVVHKVEALEDTTFLTINGIVKNHTNYEKTVIRVEF